MSDEIPSITTSSFTANAFGLAEANLRDALHGGNVETPRHFFAKPPIDRPSATDVLRHGTPDQLRQFAENLKELQPMLRVVRVYIADVTEALPLDKRVIYSGTEHTTDLTDQELFYEIPISQLLAKHNEYRKTVLDRKAAEKLGKDFYLDAVRIKDLKMVVVEVAKFQ